MTPEQQEARAERIAIMQVESVPQEDIAKVLKAYPHLYGIECEEIKQEELI